METKICSKCHVEKPNDEDYFPKRNNKLEYRCKSCRKEYYDIWKFNNAEAKKQYDKDYRAKNYDKLKKYTNEYNENFLYKNGVKRHTKYWQNNKEKIKTRREKNRNNENILRNKKRNERRKVDPLFNLQEKIRTKLNKLFKNNGYKKNKKTIDVIGCSFKNLKLYIESKFESWMNWENHGLYNGQLYYGWDIDHVIPLCTAKTEEESLKLWYYTNLQPLCSKINRDIKKDKINFNCAAILNFP